MKILKELLLLPLIIGLLCIFSCSEGTTGAKYHGSDWEDVQHKTAALENSEDCKECHGDNFFGGTSGIDCYDCHFSPTGSYVESDVAEILGIAPADDEDDGSGNSVVTSSLPNVAVNTYVYLKAIDITGNDTVEWDILVLPAGSSTTLTTKSADTVKFLPDTVGFYKVDVTVTKGAVITSDSLVIYANRWVGSAVCAGCHQNTSSLFGETHHYTANDRKLESFYNGGYYRDYCQKCHTVGYNAADYAVNGGYDDIAEEAGFTFDSLLLLDSFDDFATTYPKVAAMSNIQCENCHGPGEDHKGVSSLSEKVCGQCHNSPTHHVKVYQWTDAGHGDHDSRAFTYPVGETRKSCVKCHTGGGFIDYVNGIAQDDRRTEHQVISCAVCHDIHGDENEHQIRTTSDVTLANDEEVRSGGLGKLCMNCHQSRRDVDTYTAEYHSHYGPHYAPQTDVYVGTGGYEYGMTISSTLHSDNVADSCVRCHMATPDNAALINPITTASLAGEHTFKMEYNNIENVKPCVGCHSGITTFNFTASGDYDGDGATEGLQDEVTGILEALALKLPPLNVNEVTVAEDYTLAQLRAAYNYLLIQKDGSLGVHNLGYAVDLLQTSYNDLTGVDLPGADPY
jgi:hypothetical protein